MQKLRLKFLGWLLLASFFIMGVYGSFPVRAGAVGQQTTRYIIKVISNLPGSDAVEMLANYGFDIHLLFSHTIDPEFGNIYSFDSVLPYSTLQKELKQKSEYLEKDSQLDSVAVVTNDPGFTSNYADVDKTWGLVKTGFTAAWLQTTGSTANIVAIIDTGVDESHEDLQSIHWVEGYNFVDNKPILSHTNSDDNGHGTLIAGVIGATPNNSIGLVGTNWAISVMPIKALDAEGRGDSSAVAEGMVWAVDHGAKIINLSLGGIGFEHGATLANAISYAFTKGAVIISAAGNDVAKTGGNLDSNPVFPICDDNNENMIIGVAAVDQNDIKPDFSNYGKGCIDVTAPGKRILSTINFDPVTKQAAANSYAFASGTSLAVPFVSGQAAILWAKDPSLTNVQIRDKILATADSIDALNLTQCGGISCKGLLGVGRINVQKSLDAPTVKPFIEEGDIVKVPSGAVYQISGGQRRLVSSFVFNQRFAGKVIKNVTDQQVQVFPEGSYATPLENTLVKTNIDDSVYLISKGLKQPITYQIFLQRKFKFTDVNIVSFSELNSWVYGNFLPPLEGTLVKSPLKKTVYWVVGQSLHPVSALYFKEQGLQIFSLLNVSENDIASFPKGEAYIK